MPRPDSPLYQVFVDDNFHYQDESERYLYGAFASCEAAVAACRWIVDSDLTSAYKPGMTADELLQYYIFFGEDPFILAPGDAACKFSARTYARERCQAICEPAGPQ